MDDIGEEQIPDSYNTKRITHENIRLLYAPPITPKPYLLSRPPPPPPLSPRPLLTSISHLSHLTLKMMKSKNWIWTELAFHHLSRQAFPPHPSNAHWTFLAVFSIVYNRKNVLTHDNGWERKRTGDQCVLFESIKDKNRTTKTMSARKCSLRTWRAYEGKQRHKHKTTPMSCGILYTKWRPYIKRCLGSQFPIIYRSLISSAPSVVCTLHFNISLSSPMLHDSALFWISAQIL